MSIRESLQRLMATLGLGRSPFGASRESEIGDEHGSVTAEPQSHDAPGEPESSPRGLGGMDF
ncbi:hypothetical protein [Nocardia pseudobrasiliensis]|uniref:Uncharacterized protein n=1 Tax=Nocardia pseudobrasiliensis TaxID=45979 RepID=A0A370IDW4_9NOCA|nr:hypothetical protein [Nocardia pseudobrasiliensis]RDI68906.1 hypothetical protein DFR76_101442 [Nocardia pseudobrasiliensis]